MMKPFNIDNLKPPLKDVYEAQNKWCDTNWQETLKKHNKELNKSLEKADLFDVWSNKLQNDSVAKSLIPEVFMDAYLSIHFACMGLYKYANSCLRSELETALRLVYFSTHPIEFGWWCDGNEWYKGKDVWGSGYVYFELLNNMKEFDKNLSDEKKLFVRIRNIYGVLSQYVHSSKSTFQTHSKFSPKYNIEDFKNWSGYFNETQQFVNIILTLGLDKKFYGMNKNDQKKILKIGLYDKDYKKRVKDIFKLKIKGRI